MFKLLLGRGGLASNIETWVGLGIGYLAVSFGAPLIGATLTPEQQTGVYLACISVSNQVLGNLDVVQRIDATMSKLAPSSMPNNSATT